MDKNEIIKQDINVRTIIQKIRSALALEEEELTDEFVRETIEAHIFKG